MRLFRNQRRAAKPIPLKPVPKSKIVVGSGIWGGVPEGVTLGVIETFGEGEIEPVGEGDGDIFGEPDGDGDGVTDADGLGDGDTDGDGDGEIDGDGDGEGLGDSDGDGEGDTDGEGDGDTEGDGLGDSEIEGDGELNGSVGVGVGESLSPLQHKATNGIGTKPKAHHGKPPLVVSKRLTSYSGQLQGSSTTSTCSSTITRSSCCAPTVWRLFPSPSPSGVSPGEIRSCAVLVAL